MLISYASADTHHGVGKMHAFWTALVWFAKEVPEFEQLFLLSDAANARTGRRGGEQGVSE